jgi:6-pyruvoyltetrahydropterin/6-carboxytetrahydropterin synthase
MYEVRVEGRFRASHGIILRNGTREPDHVHDWKVWVVFRGENLDRLGVLVDFVDVDAALGEILRGLEGADLNNLPAMQGENPTAENVARLVFAHLAERMGHAAPLVAVYVEEAPGCVAGYLRERGESDTG